MAHVLACSRSLKIAPFDSVYDFLLAFYSKKICPYLALFLIYSEILVENRRFSPIHLYLAPLFMVTPLEFRPDI